MCVKVSVGLICMSGPLYMCAGFSMCVCAGSIPPQALLAVEIEGVLCTAGMKAG